MRRIARLLILGPIALGVATPAFADITAFLGTTSTPTNRAARGGALGFGLLIVGFEFEFSSTAEDPLEAAPSLNMGTGNVLLQTPFPIFGFQPYVISGAGLYREALGTESETSIAVSTGGGVKVSLLGPVRARIDYRVFNLRGDPLHATVHRFYAGLNLTF
jgi:hypothetical protein